MRPGEEIDMKTLLICAVIGGALWLPTAVAQAPDGAKTTGCTKCGAAVASSAPAGEASLKPLPGSTESMVVGRIENVVPIGILTVLGCERCAAEAVKWALQQGSSADDVERALKTVGMMRKLDCFKDQFGPDATARMEKPLAAAWEALGRAKTDAVK
jgi:hypothetical protein